MRKRGESSKVSFETLDTSRSGHYRKTQSGQRPSILNETMVEKIKELRLAHPFWGYKKMMARLRYLEGYGVNRKRIQKLMRENGLTIQQKRHKALQTSQRAKPRATWPNQH